MMIQDNIQGCHKEHLRSTHQEAMHPSCLFIMLGEDWKASSNPMRWPLIPDMPETISGAETRRNGTPHSLAMAFASAVFPHPGGPWRRTPLGGSTPNQAYT